MAQACCIFPMPAKVTFQAKIDLFVFLPVVPAMAGSTIEQMNCENYSAVAKHRKSILKTTFSSWPTLLYICTAIFSSFFYRSVFVFDKIDLNTSVFVLCSLVKVQVSGERLDSLEMPGHQVMFRFLPKFQKFISGEINIATFRGLLLTHKMLCYVECVYETHLWNIIHLKPFYRQIPEQK